MQQRNSHRIRRMVVAAAAGVAATIAMAVPADAHLPVVLTDANTARALATSPYVPDGTISFAFYGWLERPGDTRAVRVNLQAGQQFNVQLLIPDLAPENTLRRWQLPQLRVIAPGGAVRCVPSTQRVPFAEPYTSTNYLVLSELVEASTAGTYALIVTGGVPARFVLVTGAIEQRSGPLQNATIAGVDEVMRWYTSPTPRTPGSSIATAVGAGGAAS